MCSPMCIVRVVSDEGEGDDYMGRAFLPLSVS